MSIGHLREFNARRALGCSVLCLKVEACTLEITATEVSTPSRFGYFVLFQLMWFSLVHALARR